MKIMILVYFNFPLAADGDIGSFGWMFPATDGFVATDATDTAVN